MLFKLSAALNLLLFISSLFGVIGYLTTQNKLESLQSKYTKLQEDYSFVVESNNKLQQSLIITDNIVANKEDEINRIKETSCDEVETILTYVPKQSTSVNKSGDRNDQTKYVDIDAPFSPDVLRMYKGSN